MIAGREGCHGYTIDLSNITCFMSRVLCHALQGLDDMHLNWFIFATGGRKLVRVNVLER